jgi:RND family efflux transporter MFP subunit
MNKIIWAVVIFALGAYLFTHLLPEKETATPVVSADRLTVSTVKPQKKTFEDIMRITGATIPRHDILITTELSSVRVSEVLADVGDEVKVGQVLARLDTSTQKNELGQIQSDYTRALDEYKRISSIKDTGAVSKESVVQKRTAMESAKAKLDEAKLSIERGIITAPSDGRIYERNLNVGGIISGDTPLFRLIGGNDIEIEATIPEADIGRIQIGQKALIKLTGFESMVEGQIRLISPAINKDTRSASIRIAMTSETPIPAGLFADVVIVLGEITGVSIPFSTLQEDERGSFVWVIGEGNKIRRHDVLVKKLLLDDIIIEPIGDVTLVARAGAFVKEGEIVTPAITTAAEVKP